MDAKVIAALITAITSLVVAVISLVFSKRQEKHLIKFRNDIEEAKASRDARRDYEYEARKRLYQECEPLLFQLVELAENAIHRVFSLARSARDGSLQVDGSGWLSQDGYYLRSTIYTLLVPMTVYKILKKRLTVLDLSVEPRIQTQYELMKLHYYLSDAFRLAKEEPELPYCPNVDDWREKRKNDPQKYWRQWLPIARLDATVESLIVSTDGTKDRYISFAEFESVLKSKDSEKYERFSKAIDLFLGFHPESRPVLWRILIAHIYLYQALIANQRTRGAGFASSIYPLPVVLDRCKWSSTIESNSDERFIEPFVVVERYIHQNAPESLQKVFAGLSWGEELRAKGVNI